MTTARKNALLFALIALIGTAIDLGTKQVVFNWLSPAVVFDSGDYTLIPNHFSLTTSLNQGALFGFGQGGTFIFAGLSIAAAIGIFYWLFFAQGHADRWLSCALGLVTAGIFGNLYDRLGFHGLRTPTGEKIFAVRDWIFFRTINFPIFNLADSCLVVGAAILFLYSFFAGRARRRHAESGLTARAC